MTTRQYEMVAKTVSGLTGMAEMAPTKAMSDWAKTAANSFIEAQKQWSEIAIGQGEELMKTVQSGADFSNPDVIGGIQSAGETGIETFVKMRKAWLNFAAEQNKQMIEALKAGFSLDSSSPATAVAEFAQQTMNSYVEIQKRWLDMATQLPMLGGSSKKRK